MYRDLDADEHPRRRLIEDLLAENPGLSFTDLRVLLGAAVRHAPLGTGTVSHHLRVLERAGRVRSHRSGRCRRFYLARAPWSHLTALSELQRPGAARIARLILERPAPCQTELWQAIRVGGPRSRQSISYQLMRLEACGLVAVERAGRTCRYRPTALLQNALAVLSMTGTPDVPPSAA